MTYFGFGIGYNYKRNLDIDCNPVVVGNFLAFQIFSKK